MLQESYVTTVIKGQVIRKPISTFPQNCPNCYQNWQPRENWQFYGSYKKGGKDAICRYCGCHMHEVICTERNLPQAE
jgi:hypothetical protein